MALPPPFFDGAKERKLSEASKIYQDVYGMPPSQAATYTTTTTPYNNYHERSLPNHAEAFFSANQPSTNPQGGFF